MSTWQMQRMTYTAEALADLIITNPGATNGELGAVFGRTPQWVSMVKSSGMFKEMMHARRAELIDPVLAATVEERIEMLATRSLDILNEKLSQPAMAIPDSLVLAAAALGAKAMGIGGFSSKPAPPPAAPATDRIERLAERLTNLGRGQVVDVEARVLPAPA